MDGSLHGTAWHRTATGDRLIKVLPQLDEEQCPWEQREAVPKKKVPRRRILGNEGAQEQRVTGDAREADESFVMRHHWVVSFGSRQVSNGNKDYEFAREWTH